jgi:hypothetical protein
MNKEITQFLDYLNSTYAKLHKSYENLFWVSYMGDHLVNEKMKKALSARDVFRSDRNLHDQVVGYMKSATATNKKRLGYWKLFFEKYQMPQELLGLKNQIDELEMKINKAVVTRTEGYVDPKTGAFVKASKNKMIMMVRTESDPELRKAAYLANEKLSAENVEDYVTLVGLRNEFAKKLGFEDFYAYKLETEEGMKKKDLFKLFDDIYNNAKFAFKDIRALEKKMPGLRAPWNFNYMLAGNFTKEEDPHFPFEEALTRWATSFAALGINFKGGDLQLDLMDREGKSNNGFCHYPNIVHRVGKEWRKGSSNFTCNVVYGQVGSAASGYHTLFHEAGHAADRLNSEQAEACINTEYPPASTAWAETHSMFMDTMYASIEWKSRYAKTKEGTSYPFDLFQRKVEKIGLVAPLNMMGIHNMMEFERRVYEAKNLTAEKVLNFARQGHKKFFDRTYASVDVLGAVHIYSWETACSYHGYGLAELALTQWREYFYNKYGYIVDNPKVGKEMIHVWKAGSSMTFPELVKLATGKKLSSKAFIKSTTMSVAKRLDLAKKRLKVMESVKPYSKPIDLHANIKMVHGKKVIATNKKSFEDMADKYKKWLKTQ